MISAVSTGATLRVTSSWMAYVIGILSPVAVAVAGRQMLVSRAGQ
jgi:hypothetical protein